MPYLAQSARAALLAFAALATSSARGAAQADGTSTQAEDFSISAFVDSAGLVRALAALAVPELPPGALPLFDVSFDSTGAVHSVRPMFREAPAGYTHRLLPEAYAGPVEAAIRAHLKPQAPSRDPLATHLLVVAGPEPRVECPRILERQPDLHVGQASRELRRIARAFSDSRRDTPLEAEYRTELKFRIGLDGTVDSATVEVIRSTGDAELDRRVVETMNRLHFRPAALGLSEDTMVPVKVWVVLPFDITMPERTRARGRARP